MLTLLLAACTLGAAPELNDESFEQLAAAIGPQDAEVAFLKIGWHGILHDRSPVKATRSAIYQPW